jgi:hypothetical protein
MLGENFRKSIIAFYNLGFISAPYAPPPDCFFLIRFRTLHTISNIRERGICHPYFESEVAFTSYAPWLYTPLT